MRTILCVVLLSAAVGTQQRDARVTAAGNAEIAGVVVGSDGQQPIRRAIVSISGDALATGRSVITDDAGRFSFRNLPAGSFAITAKKAAYLDTEHGSPKPGRPGSRVALAANDKRTVTLKLFRGAAISGNVRHPSGAPAPGIAVMALDTKGGRRNRALDSVVTDDQGEYRIYGLMPGEYIVAATPGVSGSGDMGARPSAEMDAVLARLAMRRNPPPAGTTPPPPAEIPPAPAVGYAPIYFPGTPLLVDAQPIRVAAEDNRDSVSFTVSRVPVAAIKGTISGDVANLAQVQIAINLEFKELRFGGPGEGLGMTAVPPNAAGEFEFGNLSPGRYQVIARGRNASNEFVYANADVEIRGQDVPGLTLALRPGGRISGVLVFDSGGAPIPADPSRFRIGVSLVGENSFYQFAGLKVGNQLSDVPQVAVTDDSEFYIKGVGAATYTLTCTVPPDLASTWRVRSAMVDGRDLLDSVIVGPDVALQPVWVFLSDKRTEISGTLSSASGEPAADYYVIAFSTDRANWRAGSRRSMSARPATNGRFVFRDLPAGEYFIAALTDLDPDGWQAPAFLEQVASAAFKLRLAEGEKKVQDIKVAK